MLDMRVEDYRITSDSSQVIVEKVRRTDSGEISMIKKQHSDELVESCSIVGYYGNLSKALVGIQRNYLLGEGVLIRNIQEYKEALDVITMAFEESVNIGWEEFK